MIVVADASPLHYLILIDAVDLLRHLYSDVVVPDAVVRELSRVSAPAAVRDWLSAAPPWLRIVEVPADAMATVPEALDLGERAAIALAEVMRADLLLIDEAAGRQEARRRQIRVTGTLGVLRAAEKGLIDAPELIDRLQTTNFYLDEALVREVFAPWLED